MPKKLKKRLSQPGYLRVLTRHPSHIRTLRNQIKLPSGAPKGLVRFGSLTERQDSIEINSISSIINSSNKLLMKQLFDGTNCSDYYYWNGNQWITPIGELNDSDFESYIHGLFSSRKSLSMLTKLQYRSRANGMDKHDTAESVLSQVNDIKHRFSRDTNQKYIEVFYNYAKEYRLHVTEDGCFYAIRKARKSSVPSTYYINDSNCVWFTQYDSEGNLKDDFLQPDNWSDIEAEAVRLQKLIGLDIGAFDVKISNNGNFKFLEINSAPSMGEITAIKYRQELLKLYNKKLRNV